MFIIGNINIFGEIKDRWIVKNPLLDTKLTILSNIVPSVYAELKKKSRTQALPHKAMMVVKRRTAFWRSITYKYSITAALIVSLPS